MPRRLCVLIFEGRTGSSELISRLNSHPEILFYPEILHLPALPTLTFDQRWSNIDRTVSQVIAGELIEADLASYQKPGGPTGVERVVGFKTRLNEADDRSFFGSFDKLSNLYLVEGRRLLVTLVKHDAKLIRLRRRSIFRTAVSWHRAVDLANRSGYWNVIQGIAPPGPINIHPMRLKQTMEWVIKSRAAHDAVFDVYPGEKVTVEYEDMIEDWSAVENELLAFLEVPPFELRPFYSRATPGDLGLAVANLEEVRDFLRATALAGHVE